jgi:MoxR-like ATPase
MSEDAQDVTEGAHDAAEGAQERRGWFIYRGDGRPHPGIDGLPDPPPWRRFEPADGEAPEPALPSGPVSGRPHAVARAAAYRPDPVVVETVNAAIYLRRPLLVTGKPGTGKSTLAASIAHELQLGPVLTWAVTSRSVLEDALYRYDAIGRLQEANLNGLSRPPDVVAPDAAAQEAAAQEAAGQEAAAPDGGAHDVPDIGRYLRLGPLGTALLPWARPRVLLVDELDKSDLDLPNDLLNVFEEGEFEIKELTRLPDERSRVTLRTHDGGECVVERGHVRCRAFPIVVITSNGEREFPPAFRRRCLPLNILPPDRDKLRAIVEAQLGQDALAENDHLLDAFLATRETTDVSTDQLLNLVFLAGAGRRPTPEVRERLQRSLLHPLGAAQ